MAPPLPVSLTQGAHTGISPCMVIHSTLHLIRSGRLEVVYQLNMAGYLKVLGFLTRSATLSKSHAVIAAHGCQTLQQRNCEF